MKKLMMELIDNDTMGKFKANSSIGEIEVYIKWGFMKTYNNEGIWCFYINDKNEFYERDNDILLTTDRKNLKGIVIYKSLEKVEVDPNERQDFSGWK